MIIIKNRPNRPQTVCIYGGHGATTLKLINNQDNREYLVPVIDISESERYGIFRFVYSPMMEQNTSALSGRQTSHNFQAGEYNYTIVNLGAAPIGTITFVKTISQPTTYNTENNSIIYNGN